MTKSKQSNSHRSPGRPRASRGTPATTASSDAGDADANIVNTNRERSQNISAAKSCGRRRKPVGIGVALRRRGFDEYAVAENYIEVTQRLKGKTDKSGSVEKLLIDVLKECSKHLEPAKPTDPRGGQARIHIHLVHGVARPARTLPPAPDTRIIDASPDTNPDPAENPLGEANNGAGAGSESAATAEDMKSAHDFGLDESAPS